MVLSRINFCSFLTMMIGMASISIFLFFTFWEEKTEKS